MGNTRCWFYSEGANCKKRDTPVCSEWCDKYMLYSSMIGQSGLPKKFQGCFLWNFPGGVEGNRNYALVNRFMQGIDARIESGQGLYLYSSEVGTGKTTVAVTIANEYMHHTMWRAMLKPQVVYVVVPELLERIKDSWDDPDEDLTELLENLKTVPLAVWDDIGAEKPSEWVRERLYTLINRRYTEELTNIFTSNHSIDELAGRLGPRIASRIKGMCVAVQVHGTDNRGVR